MTDADQSRAVVQRLYADFAAGDVAAVLATMASDISWTEAEGYVADGETVVALGRYSGRYVHTGKSFCVPFAHAWTVNYGKRAKFVQYTDTVVVQKALQPGP